MMSLLAPWIADLLIILGLVGMTVAVAGMIWLPDLYTKVHAASKVMVIGVIPILLALLETGEPRIISRAILIVAFLFTTTPISSHVLGRAAYLKQEPMETPDSADQSGRLISGGTLKAGRE